MLVLLKLYDHSNTIIWTTIWRRNCKIEALKTSFVPERLETLAKPISSNASIPGQPNTPSSLYPDSLVDLITGL